MPCNSVAVASARLEAKIGEEIVGKAPIIEALRKWLASQYGSAELIYNTPQWVVFTCGVGKASLTVQLSNLGQLNLKGTSRLAEEQQRVNSEQAKVQDFLKSLANAAARERLVATLKRKYTVTADERAPQGARVITLSI